MFKRILCFFAILLFLNTSFALENAFYILRSKAGVPNLAAHYTQVKLLMPQAYVIDQNGLVSGMINPETFDFFKRHNLTVMAMVTNAGFDRDRAHKFLSNPAAQQRALQTLLLVAQKNKLAGLQFDFEGVHISDSVALTKFYTQAAELLHKNNLKISFAAIAIADGTQESAFTKRQFQNWSGVYDLKTLAPVADFITLMSYDQHNQGTTPGPTANIGWVESTIVRALRSVPAEKLSLGIAVYSNYWRTTNSGTSVKVILACKTYANAVDILKKHHAALIWDPTNQINYAFYNHDWLNEYVFIEDARSFKAKYDLAKKYNLRGVSVFSIGSEDPNIWNELPPAQVAINKETKNEKNNKHPNINANRERHMRKDHIYG